MPFPDSNSVWKEQHPDEGTLHEWLEEQLDTEAAARIAAHVSTCESCRARVAEAHGLIAASRRILTSLDDVPAGVIPSTSPVARVSRDNSIMSISKTAADATATSVNANPRRAASTVQTPAARPDSFRWRRWGSIAAVLAIGVTGLFVVSRNGNNTNIPGSVSERTFDSTQSPASTPVAAAQQPATPIALSAPAPAQTASASTSRTPSAPPSNRSANVASDSIVPRDAAAAGAGSREAFVSQKRAANEPPSTVPPAADRRDLSRETSAKAVVAAGAVAAAAPPVVSNSTSDTLAQRLESERRKAASAEAVAADPSRRPRVDAVGAAAQGYTSPEKQREATISAPRNAPPPSGAGGRGGVQLAMTTSSAAPSAAAPAFDSLTLSREPCFGRCPAYELRVSGAGVVRYLSQHPDDNGRAYNAQLPDSVVGRLHDLIQRSRVDTLKSYMPRSASCGNEATDMPTLHLSVYRGGRVFKLDQYLGCSAGTQAVPRLMREIDSIVGTQRWLPTGYKLN